MIVHQEIPSSSLLRFQQCPAVCGHMSGIMWSRYVVIMWSSCGHVMWSDVWHHVVTRPALCGQMSVWSIRHLSRVMTSLTEVRQEIKQSVEVSIHDKCYVHSFWTSWFRSTWKGAGGGGGGERKTENMNTVWSTSAPIIPHHPRRPALLSLQLFARECRAGSTCSAVSAAVGQRVQGRRDGAS